MSTIMKEEILSTAALLKNTEKSCEKVCARIAETVREKEIDRVFLACRGSSENAGIYFRYLLETMCGMPVTVINPSVITLYGANLDMSSGLLVAVSQGGRGVDIRMVTEKAAEQGVPTVAVTNFPDSPIGKACGFVLPLSVELERSMAATKSFTAEMYALYLLSCAISGKHPSSGIPASFEKGTAAEEDILKALGFFDGDRPVYVLGRGKTSALAKEMCCKLQETCLVNAFPFSAADFMHGPFALVEKGSRAVVFHTRHACSDSTLEMIGKLLEQGASVLAITDDEGLEIPGCTSIFADCPGEDESVFAMTAVLQLLAADLSEVRGTNPDTSRNLNKYTETI